MCVHTTHHLPASPSPPKKSWWGISHDKCDSEIWADTNKSLKHGRSKLSKRIRKHTEMRAYSKDFVMEKKALKNVF